MSETILEPAKVIHMLNDLIEINRDGQKGFQDAAEKLTEQDIKTFCKDQGRTRAKFLNELQPLVSSLGKQPENTGTVAGALRRGWMNLKAAFGGGDHAILVVIESSEQHAVSEYQKALDSSLSLGLRSILERQSNSVMQAHYKLKELCERTAKHTHSA